MSTDRLNSAYAEDAACRMSHEAKTAQVAQTTRNRRNVASIERGFIADDAPEGAANEEETEAQRPIDIILAQLKAVDYKLYSHASPSELLVVKNALRPQVRPVAATGPHLPPKGTPLPPGKSVQPLLLVGLALAALVFLDTTRKTQSYTYRGAKQVSETCRASVDRLLRFM